MSGKNHSGNDSDQIGQFSPKDCFDMLEHAPIGVFASTPEGRFFSVNPALVRMYGYATREELIDSINDITSQLYADPADRNEFRRLLEEQGELINYEYRLLRKDGSIFWVSTTVRSVLDEQGSVICYQGFTTDITDRKQSEAEAEKSRASTKQAEEALLRKHLFLQGILESSPTPFFSVDRDYRYTSFNQAHAHWMKELYGVDIELGHSLYEYQTVPEDSQTSRINLDRALLGEQFNEEAYFGRQDLTRQYIKVTHNPIRDERGQVIGVSVFIQDITERETAEQNLGHRLIYEQMLSRISTMAVQHEELERFIDDSLITISETLDVSRVYLFEHHHETDSMDNTFEWCAPEESPQKDSLQGLSSSAVPWWMATLKEGRIICFSDIEDIPDEGAKEILRPQGIHSILAVPLFVVGRYHGFMGFDECRFYREWPEEDVEILLAISRIIAGALYKKQSEEKIERERQQLLSIFNSIEENIYISDPETYEILYVNPKLANILQKDCVGGICHKEFHWLDEPCTFCTNDIILKHKPLPHYWEYYNPKLERHFSLVNRIIEWPDGRNVRFEMATDISERTWSEEALHQLNKTLEQQVVERTELAETRARQLQALAVELIEAEERERQRIAELLHDDLQQMLASARFQLKAGNVNLENEPILANINEILGESIAISRRLSHELSPPVLYHGSLYGALEWLGRQMQDQFGLTIELKDEKSPNLENKPLKVFLFRAVQELLFNIVKHAGVKSARVTLMGSIDTIAVFVADQGKGFNKDIIDSSPERSGFGLISIRERADRIGGHLKIESEPGQGSSFLLVLPIQTAPAKVPVKTGELTDAAVPKSISVVNRLRVLFADDHKVMRQGLITLISGQTDIEVAGEAANGREAVELARQLRPDVIVMDISMPVMDGIEATRLIRSEFPKVRIVGLSMYEDEQSIKSIIHAGADAFVPKTASPEEFLNAIYGN